MRTRLLVGTIVLTMAAIAALFIPAAIALAAAEREAQVVELQREAVDAAARLDPFDPAGSVDDDDDLPVSDDPTEGPEPGTDNHQFGVYDELGRLQAGVGPAQLEAVLEPALVGSASAGRVGDQQVAAVPLAGGGALRASEPSSEADLGARDAIARLGLSALAVLLGGAVAAWLLARRLTEPLRQLGRAASRLGGGDFTATAPITGVVEIDEVADALNTSATRIGTLVERERRLTADTTHQLRTPIAGLRLALEGELAAPRSDPTEVIHEALGAVDRLEATVTSLTDLAYDLAATDPFPIAEVVAAAIEQWRPLYAQAHRTIDAGPVGADSSPTRRAAIETILDVLLDNALRHGEGRVVVAADATDGTARLTVTDEGSCRLDDDRLFARHQSSAGSTGIGLHLARTLAAAEGARLRLVAPDPTTFQLLLPVSGPDVDRRAEPDVDRPA